MDPYFKRGGEKTRGRNVQVTSSYEKIRMNPSCVVTSVLIEKGGSEFELNRRRTKGRKWRNFRLRKGENQLVCSTIECSPIVAIIYWPRVGRFNGRLMTWNERVLPIEPIGFIGTQRVQQFPSTRLPNIS